jgi:hypothetical protein
VVGIRAAVDLLISVEETILVFVPHIAGMRVVVGLLIGVDETIIALVLRSLSGTGVIVDDMNSLDLMARIALWGALQVDTTEIFLRYKGISLPLTPVGATEILVLDLVMTLRSLNTMEVLVIIHIRGMLLDRASAVMMELTVALLHRKLLPAILALKVVALP